MFEETKEETLPQTFVSYSADDYKTLLGKPVLREGWMQFIVKDAKQSKSRKGDLMIVLTCNPLDDKDIPRQPSGTIWLVMPFGMALPQGIDADAPEKLRKQAIATKFQNAIERNREYLKAAGVEIKRYPKFERNLQSFVDEDGVKISEDVAATMKAEAVAQVANLLQTRWADIASYKGDRFFAQVKHGEDGFVNLRYLRNSAPDGEVITSNFATVID